MDEMLNAIVKFLFPVGMVALQYRVALSLNCAGGRDLSIPSRNEGSSMDESVVHGGLIR